MISRGVPHAPNVHPLPESLLDVEAVCQVRVSSSALERAQTLFIGDLLAFILYSIPFSCMLRLVSLKNDLIINRTYPQASWSSFSLSV